MCDPWRLSGDEGRDVFGEEGAECGAFEHQSNLGGEKLQDDNGEHISRSKLLLLAIYLRNIGLRFASFYMIL